MKAQSITLINPVQAHKQLMDVVWPTVKAATFAGHEMVLKLGPKEDNRTVQQNRYYWGVVLACISEQASINGVSYTSDAWHELFKRQFLGYEIKKCKVAGKRKTLVQRRLKSTSGLAVRTMSKYLDKVQAFAATELDVQFPAPNWMEWAENNPEISHQAVGSTNSEDSGWLPEPTPAGRVVDVETGEILG